VQIGHNVEVGANTVMASQTGIAGSTKIGKQCLFAGQVGVAGHLQIADGTILGAQTGVPNSLKTPNQTYQGYPAVPVNVFTTLERCLQKTCRIYKIWFTNYNEK